MSKVPKKHNLQARKGIWYYRRRVPKDLQEAFGKSVIQYSLKTQDFIEAAKLRNVYDVEWNARFEKAEDQSDAPPQEKSALSRHEAIKLVREYVQKTDLKLQKQDAKRGTIPVEIKRDIEFELGLSEQTVADITSAEGELEVGQKVHQLLKEGVKTGMTCSWTWWTPCRMLSRP